VLIKDGLIFYNEVFKKNDIYCEDGIIKKIGFNLDKSTGDFNVVKSDGCLVLPGFVDMHTHLREPGFSYKETISSGTKAALAGGFVTLCSMPNVEPAPDCEKNLKIQNKIIQSDALCCVMPFMSITKCRAGRELIDFRKIPCYCPGISDDGNGIDDDELAQKAFRAAAEFGILISSHCEYKKFSGKLAETEHLRRDLDLVKEYKCRYHAQHLSCSESFDLVRRAKYLGLPVTCEVTPHHVCFCQNDVRDSGNFKMSPPLRSQNDKESVVKALLDGTIDVIATDHAPHSPQEKERGFLKSLNGVSGLEVAFASLYTNLVCTGRINLSKLVNLLTLAPSRILGLRSAIAVGEKANLTIVNLENSWKVEGKKFYSKGKSTPFEGKIVKSSIEYTIFNGNILFKR
jgi:dihydroorotase